MTLAALTLLLALSPRARPTWSRPGSVEAIAAATTEPRFLSPWVLLPRFGDRTVAARFLGRIAGAPGELVDTAKAYGLLPRARGCLAAREASSRSAERRRPRHRAARGGGRERHSDLDRLKAATAALADPGAPTSRPRSG